MDKEVARLINRQINHELYSAYIYLGFSHFYARLGLSGFEHWFLMQAREETEHALEFLNYLTDNGEEATLDAIPRCDIVPSELTDPLHAALKHEKYVTSLINNIYDAAEGAKDYRTQRMLDAFITEQAEEEKSAASLLSRATMIGGDSAAIYMLDKELGERE